MAGEHYPEAACDVPAPFYPYSYAPNPGCRTGSREPAILAYLKEVADTFDVRRQIRFGTEVTAAAFDETTGKWTVRVRDGESLEVDLLVSRWASCLGRRCRRLQGSSRSTG